MPPCSSVVIWLKISILHQVVAYIIVEIIFAGAFPDIEIEIMRK